MLSDLNNKVNRRSFREPKESALGPRAPHPGSICVALRLCSLSFQRLYTRAFSPHGQPRLINQACAQLLFSESRSQPETAAPRDRHGKRNVGTLAWAPRGRLSSTPRPVATEARSREPACWYSQLKRRRLEHCGPFAVLPHEPPWKARHRRDGLDFSRAPKLEDQATHHWCAKP